MNIEQLIAKSFSVESSIMSYMTERLSLDKTSAESLVSHHHAPERVEDILYAIYRKDSFSKEQKQWFWNALNQIALMAWQKRNPEVFRRTTYLYERLGHNEALAFNWQCCFNSEDIQWNENLDDDTISMYSLALWLVFKWQLPLDWDRQFKAIVKLLPKNEKLVRPLNQVFDALDTLTREHWEFLLTNCQSSRNLQDLLKHYLTIRLALCLGIAEKESELIYFIRMAIRFVKANNFKKSKNSFINEQLAKIVIAWSNTEWCSQKTKDEFEILRQELQEKPKHCPPFPIAAKPTLNRPRIAV
jgi:hypothetical protein